MERCQEFQIVSPPFACGVTWLINILLELNLKTTNLAFIEDHWLSDHQNTLKIGPKAHNHLRRHLPILSEKNSYQFEENKEIFWEHRLDMASTMRPTILFIRDPRDAIYSMYLRDYKHFAFSEYLLRPDKWPAHFPNLFDLPPSDTMALFCLFWRQLKNTIPLHIVRFEDMRANPVKEIGKILVFLKVKRNLNRKPTIIPSCILQPMYG